MALKKCSNDRGLMSPFSRSLSCVPSLECIFLVDESFVLLSYFLCDRHIKLLKRKIKYSSSELLILFFLDRQ